MAKGELELGTGSWTAEGCPVRVEYAAGVLEEVRAAAVAGFCSTPRGGVEVGGILFGRVDGDAVRIQASRPVPCGYTFGPSFTLTEDDEAGFERALDAARRDPALHGLEPVGWYHSHTRSDIFLTAQDLGLHNRFFSEPWQVALVVRPEPFGTARAGFFFREPDGSIRADGTAREFVIHPQARQARERAPARQDAQPEPAHLQPPVVQPPLRADAGPRLPAMAAPQISPRAVFEPVRPSRANWAVAVAAVVLTAAGAGLAGWAWWNSPATQPIALRVLDAGEKLQIAWNRAALPVLEADGGVLDITDGGVFANFEIGPEALREGMFTYARKTDSVEVRLRLLREGEPPVEEFVRFLGRLPAARQQAPASLPAPGVLPTVVEKSVRPPEPQPDREERMPVVQTAPAKPVVVPDAARRPEPRSFSLAQLPAKTAAVGNGELPAPPPLTPDIRSPRVLGQSAPVPQTAVTQAPPAPEPAGPSPAVPAAKAAYEGPTSGRIIWTGQLGREAVLSIDGDRASAGYVTGELPGVPVHVSAHPAELSGRSLRVFTANPELARARTEPAGPQNGWNATSYNWDPRRAGRVVVTETPGPQNGWKKLALRSGGPDVAVIIIDWRVISSQQP